MDCIHCGKPVPAERRECQSCGEDNGFPNVRIAESPAEVTALDARLRDAEISATARNCRGVLDRFGVAVLSSRAVIARSLSIIQDLIDSDRRTYTGYQRQLASGSRIAEDNRYDLVRTQVEAALFPNCQTEMLFGFLSLGNSTLRGYGAFSMVLRDEMISHRATVFEENLLTLSTKLRLMLTDPIPSGYRAVWQRRHDLAKAKLHSEVTAVTQDADFPGILVADRGGTADSDFIEVHIFGPINRYTIERIYGENPRTREDRLIWSKMQRQLRAQGIAVEVI